MLTRFEVLTAVVMKIFWDIILCSLVKVTVDSEKHTIIVLRDKCKPSNKMELLAEKQQ
jgi:hypothetical protein